MPDVIDLRRYPSSDKPKAEFSHASKPFSHVERKDGETVITRDPLGQMPLHTLVNGPHVYVANAIKDLMLVDGYEYGDVTTVKHGSSLRVPEDGEIATLPYADLYTHAPKDFDMTKLGDVEYSAEYVRKRFDEIVEELLKGKTDIACLLSGGVDSMVAAFLTSRKLPNAQTFSMGLSSGAEDIALAQEYSRAFKLPNNFVKVTREEVLGAVRESIWRSEIYHLYNVYCAVGMVLLGRELCRRRIADAMSGEGANEAFGDYHNWDMKKQDGSVERIQSTDISTFNSPKGRHAYIWGNPNAESRGIVNRQLGSGLAKHGTSRMYKPMHEYGVQLVSPFMNVDVMRVMASIPDSALEQVGGKPGFMALVFDKDIKSGKLPQDFFTNRKKTRLQDANPDGQGGITETLLKAGFSQEKVIEIFNTLFGANITSDDRFTNVTLK